MVTSKVRPALGVDFGGVIVSASDEGTSRSSRNGFGDLDPVPGAFEALRTFADLLGSRVWVMSKASRGTERWTRQWLGSHHFFQTTRIPWHHVLFVSDRAGKRYLCQRYKITHFVDDQIANLELLIGHVGHLFIFGASARDISRPQQIKAVSDWKDAERAICETLFAKPE